MQTTELTSIGIIRAAHRINDVKTNIKRLVQSPPENSRVVTFTPAIAAWVLETYNQNNRPKKPTNIAKYSKDMKAGEWGLTGETIKFSDRHRLRDGQNRMMACVRSGASFTTHVVFGVEDKLFHVMDTGKPRSAADVLSIAGYTSTTNLASALRWANILMTDPTSRSGLTNDQALKMVQGDYAGVEASMPTGARIYSQYGHPTGQAAALHWLFSKVDPETANAFFSAWASGNRAGRAKPIGRMQDALVRAKDMNHGRLHDTIRAAMIVKGWNLYFNKRKGGPRSCIMVQDEKFPNVRGIS